MPFFFFKKIQVSLLEIDAFYSGIGLLPFPLDLITLVIVNRLVLLPQVFVQMLNEFV